ncbi:MAG: hypothetical protein BRC54_09185 [Cyanobacteria bacterium SW_7_48_12]|nr:MAG: hypothetical protein BRC54_09185 [Cyanobacteria bacterium SW_7_48_12]
MLTLSYEKKLKPTDQQVEIIEHTLNTSRSVWNHALRKRKDWINSRKCSLKFCSLEREDIIPADEPYPSYQRQAKSLTEAKKVNTSVQDKSLKNKQEKGFMELLETNETLWIRLLYCAIPCAPMGDGMGLA